jgi:hypothetical protein
MTDVELELIEKDNGLPANVRKTIQVERGSETHTTAYLKLAHRLRAKRMVLQEALLIEALEKRHAGLADQDKRLATAAKEIKALTREVERLRNHNTRELAAPAMAVDANPTGR